MSDLLELEPSGPKRPTRVLLADPHSLVLEALSVLLATDHEVVGCVRDGETAVRETRRLEPDLVVAEVNLSGVGGLEAARRIHDGCPGTRVVFLTDTRDASLAAECFAAGASGFLLKTTTGADLRTALREVGKGRRMLCRDIAGGRPEDLPERSQSRDARGGLSPRTREVVRRLAQGLTMKEVGAALGITPRTVAFHKYRAMGLLGIESSAGLVRFAVESGLLGDTARRRHEPTGSTGRAPLGGSSDPGGLSSSTPWA